MIADTFSLGASELRAARGTLRSIVCCAAVFSVFVNILMLTGPLYMLQVYDRVLGSGSVETLVALTGIVAFLYLMMSGLDAARGRIMARAGAQFQARLERRVFGGMLRHAAQSGGKAGGGGLADLRAVQGLMSSPIATAAFDIPFAPLFLAGIWIFHPALGTLAIGGGVILLALAMSNQAVTRQAAEDAGIASHRADMLASHIAAAAETVQAAGMRGGAFDRWQALRVAAMGRQMAVSDATGLFSTATRAFRLFLQSAMLGLAAYLVLQGQLTPGAMIAASILLGRALAPLELVVAQWPLLQRARQGWRALSALLGETPLEAPRTALPRPAPRLTVRHLSVAPPGQSSAALRGIDFTLEPGQALGVIGPSGAGKSTLARAIAGLWPAAVGDIRLGGATLDQYGPDMLGRHIGYLPQRVHVFDGTIADNIARLADPPDAEAVIAAARRADAHDMIIGLPQGYDTRITGDGGRLSGGQLQRIALARAMFADPVMLVLDEPNSNLDNDGSEAVNAAIRRFKQEGKSVVIVAHRPAAIKECDVLLMLDGGNMRSFGTKSEVLGEVVRNRTQIVPRSDTPPSHRPAAE